MGTVKSKSPVVKKTVAPFRYYFLDTLFHLLATVPSKGTPANKYMPTTPLRRMPLP